MVFLRGSDGIDTALQRGEKTNFNHGSYNASRIYSTISMASLETYPSINNPEYQYLYRHLFLQYMKRGLETRTLPIRIGCKISALLYGLICLLWNKNRHSKDPSEPYSRTIRWISPDGFFEQINSIIKLNVENVTISNSTLEQTFLWNKLSGQNFIISGDPEFLTEEGLVGQLPGTVSDEGTYPKGDSNPATVPYSYFLSEVFHFSTVQIFGVVFGDSPEKELVDHIIHFFAIRKEGDVYTLVSSYGSDYVEIQQYETVIDRGEFRLFIVELSKSENRDMDLVTRCLKKYFLDNKKGVTFSRTGKAPLQEDEEFNGLEFKNTDEAVDTEIKNYYDSREGIYCTFKIVAFMTCMDEMKKIVKDFGGMRKKRTRKGKRKYHVSRKYRSYSSLRKK